MKLRIERERLLEALSTTARAVSRSGGAGPAATGVRLKTKGTVAQLVGFSPELSIEDRFEVEAATDGLTVLPARLTLDVVRSLTPGSMVELTVDGADAEIVSGRSRFSIRTLAAEDFPELPRVPAAAASLDTEAFATALRQVLPAAATDPARPILSGVLLAAEESGLRLVATDSYRLAVRDLPGATVLSAGQSVVIPAAALAEVVRLLSTTDTATLRLSDKEAHFEVGSVRLSTRLVEGQYPNYKALIPAAQPNRLVMAKAELVAALGRIKILCTAPTDPVAWELSQSRLRLHTAGAGELGSAGEDLDGSYAGADMTVGVRPDFLRAAIEAVDDDHVVVGFGSDALHPVLVDPPTPDGVVPSQRSLVMPTRLA